MIFALALVDLIAAAHLALYQWNVIDTVWDPVFQEGSLKVLDSRVSEAFHDFFLVPDAAVGAAAYLAEALLALLGSTRRWRRQAWLVVLFGANAVLVAMAGLVLVVLQATVVGAWCLLCIATAVLSFPMPWLAWRELRASVGVLRGG